MGESSVYGGAATALLLPLLQKALAERVPLSELLGVAGDPGSNALAIQLEPWLLRANEPEMPKVFVNAFVALATKDKAVHNAMERLFARLDVGRAVMEGRSDTERILLMARLRAERNLIHAGVLPTMEALREGFVPADDQRPLLDGEAPTVAEELIVRAEEGATWQPELLDAARQKIEQGQQGFIADLALRLCPLDEPQSLGAWRSVYWSALLAQMAGREAIGHHHDGLLYLDEILRPYLDHLIEHDVLPPSDTSAAVQAAVALYPAEDEADAEAA